MQRRCEDELLVIGKANLVANTKAFSKHSGIAADLWCEFCSNAQYRKICMEVGACRRFVNMQLAHNVAEMAKIFTADFTSSRFRSKICGESAAKSACDTCKFAKKLL